MSRYRRNERELLCNFKRAVQRGTGLESNQGPVGSKLQSWLVSAAAADQAAQARAPHKCCIKRSFVKHTRLFCGERAANSSPRRRGCSARVNLRGRRPSRTVNNEPAALELDSARIIEPAGDYKFMHNRKLIFPTLFCAAIGNFSPNPLPRAGEIAGSRPRAQCTPAACINRTRCIKISPVFSPRRACTDSVSTRGERLSCENFRACGRLPRFADAPRSPAFPCIMQRLSSRYAASGRAQIEIIAATCPARRKVEPLSNLRESVENAPVIRLIGKSRGSGPQWKAGAARSSEESQLVAPG